MTEKRQEVTVTRSREQERPAIAAILRGCAAFAAADVAAALEVLDACLARPGGQSHQVYTASRAGAVAGHVCFGPDPRTDGTFTLFWIAVDPAQRRHGVGRSLLTLAEYEISRQGGRLVAVETSSREECHDARKFLHDLGYRQAAAVADYYGPGDAKIILTKRTPRPA